MKKFIAIFLILSFFLTVVALPKTSNITVRGQSLCDFVPCKSGGCVDGECASSLLDLNTLIRTGLSTVFVLIIAYGIFLIIRAALKIIRSEGDKDKVQEGIENVRGVFFGLIIIFVGIIGIVLITVLFNATNIFNQSPGEPPLIDTTGI